MKVLLFGPNGQVGRALRQVLPPLGEVVSVGRDRADFGSPGALTRIVLEERPDVVVNAAAYTAVDKAESEPELARQVNMLAPGEIADATREIGATFIHYSTDYVFDGAKDGPYLEDDPTAPLNVYGSTKREGELAVSAIADDYLIFRTSWVHGPGGNNFIAKIIKLAGERDELKVIGDQVGAPTSAATIAAMTARAIAARADGKAIEPGIYHLAAAGETSWNGYARFLVGEARRKGAQLRVAQDAILEVPSTAFPAPARRPRNSRLSTARLSKALGIAMPDWRDGALETLDAVLREMRT